MKDPHLWYRTGHKKRIDPFNPFRARFSRFTASACGGELNERHHPLDGRAHLLTSAHRQRAIDSLALQALSFQTSPRIVSKPRSALNAAMDLTRSRLTLVLENMLLRTRAQRLHADAEWGIMGTEVGLDSPTEWSGFSDPNLLGCLLFESSFRRSDASSSPFRGRGGVDGPGAMRDRRLGVDRQRGTRLGNGKTPDSERLRRVSALAAHAHHSVVGPSEVARAQELEAWGIAAYDALHLACAESGGADVLLTTDDRFMRVSRASPGIARSSGEPSDLVEGGE